MADTPAPCGRLRGRTRSTAIYLRRARMMVRSSYGRSRQAQGSAAGGWIKIKEHTLHTASGEYHPPATKRIHELIGPCGCSELRVVGAPRARRHPRVRVVGRKGLGVDFQKWVMLPP